MFMLRWIGVPALSPLDKELQQIIPVLRVGTRGDKLFQSLGQMVRMGYAADSLLRFRVHEIICLEERMYLYHYRSFDIHKRVISLQFLG